MGSATVEAQRLANEANLQIAQGINDLNMQLTRETNQQRIDMFNGQNAWNKYMWDEQNKYNDPSAQMERLMKAGINPIWAMSDPSSGNAQQLTSADAPALDAAHMERAEVQPEYDPYIAQHVGNIIAAARNVVNDVQGFMGLDLQRQDVETRRAGQISRSSLDVASAAEKRAAAEGRGIENAWNLSTFDVRAKFEGQKLSNMQKQYDLLDANTEEAKAKKLLIDEQKNLVSEQINQVIESIRQRDRQLNIMQQGVNVDRTNAETRQNLYDLENERFSKEVQNWNNRNILDYMSRFASKVKAGMDASVGGSFGHIGASVDVTETRPYDVRKMNEAGIVIMQRASADPSPQNLQAAGEAARYMQMFEDQRQRRNMFRSDYFDSSNTSVLNPSDPWQ